MHYDSKDKLKWLSILHKSNDKGQISENPTVIAMGGGRVAGGLANMLLYFTVLTYVTHHLRVQYREIFFSRFEQKNFTEGASISIKIG